MSTSHVWDRNTLPEGMYVAEDGRTLLVPQGATQRWEPTPRLSAEVSLWTRPPAALAFPFHSVGVAELVRRADELLEDTGAFVGLNEDEITFLGKRVWACADALYTPGVAVRTALDGFAGSAGNWLPSLSAYDGEERAKVKGVSALAAWAVVRAACDWVAEAS